MARQPAEKRTVDRDGVVRVRRERGSIVPALIVSALALVAGALFLLFSAGGSAPVSEERPPRRAAPKPIATTPPNPEPGLHPVDPPSPAPASAPAPVVSEPVQEATISPDRHDENSGLALFHPGIKPIKVGIVVPDGFELPPGYVRHYQTTDDGQMLAPILMFHPDHPPLDAQGQPMKVPADRIVPPELAPPGMPIRMLEPPKSSTDEDVQH